MLSGYGPATETWLNSDQVHQPVVFRSKNVPATPEELSASLLVLLALLQELM